MPQIKVVGSAGTETDRGVRSRVDVQMIARPLYTEETAAYLGVGVTTLAELRNRRDDPLPMRQQTFGHRRWFIDQVEASEWLERNSRLMEVWA
jgi:hypothetical protein